MQENELREIALNASDIGDRVMRMQAEIIKAQSQLILVQQSEIEELHGKIKSMGFGQR